MLQNAQCYKTPNATNAQCNKWPLQNAQCYKTPNFTKRPILQNVQNKVRDSILFNTQESAALGPLAHPSRSARPPNNFIVYFLFWVFCNIGRFVIGRSVALGVLFFGVLLLCIHSFNRSLYSFISVLVGKKCKDAFCIYITYPTLYLYIMFNSSCCFLL